MAQVISDKFVKSVQRPETGNRIFYDDQISGFGIRITKAGAKSFILNFHLAARERRMTIGQYPAWSVLAAREEAKRLKRLVDQGHDPLEQRNKVRQAPTVEDLWKAYRVKHLSALRPGTQADVVSMWRVYILPKLGKMKLHDLSSSHVDDLHYTVSQQGAIRANRVCSWFRAALNLAVRWEWIERNPATGFKRNLEQPREMFLTAEQVGVILDCLERMPNQKAANIIRLLILTGSRLGEVRKAEWTQFDLAAGVWTKPSANTKQKKAHRVPLSPEACELLSRMKANATGQYLFANAGGTPIADIKPSWRWLMREIKIPNLRLHDLRHTYASLLISSGEGLPVIGRLLGHTQQQTTLRYAHLLDDPLRCATNKIGIMSGLKNRP